MTTRSRMAARGLGVGLVGLLLLLGVGLSGCRTSPVSSDAPRSPYERYAALRGQTVPKTVTDSFGREKPNLRGRLGGGDGM